MEGLSENITYWKVENGYDGIGHSVRYENNLTQTSYSGDYIVSQYHPSGGSFSGADVAGIIQDRRMIEIRAFGRDTLYQLIPTEETTNLIASIYRSSDKDNFIKALEEVRKQIQIYQLG